LADVRLRDRLSHLSGAHSYGLVLLLVVTAFVLMAAAPDGPIVRLITAGVQAAILVTVYVTGGVRPRWRNVAILVALAALLVAGLSHLGTEDTGRIASGVVSAVLVLVASAGIARGIGLLPVVNLRTISGVVTIYLMIGLFYAFVYETVAAASTGQFFAAGQSETVSNFLYFSYVTQATVGYGDFTAAGRLGHTLSVTEALIGQLYLVTVVALVVANVGRTRPPRAKAAADDAAP
jgi:hypothetical protein